MNEDEVNRQAKHRLTILRHRDEVTGNDSATCRYYGIGRTASTNVNATTPNNELAVLRSTPT